MHGTYARADAGIDVDEDVHLVLSGIRAELGVDFRIVEAFFLHARPQSIKAVVESLLAEDITESDLHGRRGGGFGWRRFEPQQNELVEIEIFLDDEVHPDAAVLSLRNG